MPHLILGRGAQIIAASGLILMASPVGAQSQTPAQAEKPTQTMPCPMMQGGMGSGMIGQGGGMMNWQQMREEMQTLHQEIVKLREELQKRGRR